MQIHSAMMLRTVFRTDDGCVKDKEAFSSLSRLYCGAQILVGQGMATAGARLIYAMHSPHSVCECYFANDLRSGLRSLGKAYDRFATELLGEPLPSQKIMPWVFQ